MRFEHHFDVDASLEEVWATVLDVERVAPTVPGAQVLERTGEDAYKVAIKVKVGPMSMTYRGEVEITERDEAAHRAVMKARAKESRGQGMADADVTMVLSGADGGTSATVITDVELSGKVATMGQGVLQDVSGRLVQTFAQNLAAMLEGGAGEAAAAGTGSSAAGAPDPGRSAAASGAAQGSTEGDRMAARLLGASVTDPALAEAAGATSAQADVATPADVAHPTPAEAAGATPSGEPGTTASGPTPAGTQDAPAGAPRRPPAPEPAEALDLGSIGGAVLAERLRDPRRLGGLVAIVALLAFWLGRRSAGG